MTRATTYRPDIDGLRAIAVMSVLLFHLDVSWLSGGFVGVDIFFVISGFLITRLIYAEMKETGTFSFNRFYLRRFMRLLPAAFIVLIAVLIAGYFLLLPDAYARLGKISAAAVFSLSNFFFWSEAGYFDVEATLKPLLHTWTLGVEEQFYLVWPITLWVLLSRKALSAQYWVPVIFLMAVGLASLISAEWMLNRSSETAFYLLPFRICEFAIGAGLVWIVDRFLLHKLLYEICTFCGLMLIGFAVFVFDEVTRFPGLMALIPCVGTGLIIFAGHKSRYISFGLKLGPVIAVGLISYSLYLVHWPLIVFFKIKFGDSLDLTAKAGLLLVSIVLAALLYKFIETPFRRPEGLLKRFNSKQKFSGFVGVMLLISGASAFIWHQNGWPGRYDDKGLGPLIEKSATVKTERSQYLSKVFKRENAETDQQKIVIIGDSYANDIFVALADNYTSKSFLKLTQNGCRPFLDFRSQDWTDDKAKLCERYIAKMINELQSNEAITHIIVSTRWSDESFDAYYKTIDWLKSLGKPIIVVGPRNRLGKSHPKILAEASTMDEYKEAAIKFTRYDFIDRLNEKAKHIDGATYIDMRAFQCPLACDNILNRAAPIPVIYDTAHFTIEGAQFLGANMYKAHPNLFD